MISITNDVKFFLEKELGELIIYGAGNAGYWIGKYLNKCNMDYSFYLDKNNGKQCALYNDHPIYGVDKLKAFSGIHIRLIISISQYKEVLADLLWLDHKWKLDILCAVPQYYDTVFRKEVYNINRFLSYFRNKLFIGEVPTIVSNTCAAGHIYEAFGMPLLSPTINTGMEEKDFIKFCQNLDYYTSCDLKLGYWEKELRTDGIISYSYITFLDDIRVEFSHIDSEKEIIDRWKLLCQRINWNRIIYILEEQNYRKAIDTDVYSDFMALKGEKLFFQTINSYGNDNNKCIFSPKPFLMVRQEPALENYYDLLGWFNDAKSSD